MNFLRELFGSGQSSPPTTNNTSTGGVPTSSSLPSTNVPTTDNTEIILATRDSSSSGITRLLLSLSETGLTLLLTFLSIKYLFMPLLSNLLANSSGKQGTSNLLPRKKRKIGELICRSFGLEEPKKDEETFYTTLYEKALNKYEKIVSDFLVLPEDLDHNFSDIGGMEKLKKEVYESVCFPLKYPHIYENATDSTSMKLRRLPKGVLFYGPPGTGKTSLAKAIAKECNCAFLNVKREFLSDFLYGETEKLVAALFSFASKVKPCIIFIDEIESLLPSRQTSFQMHEVSKARISIILSAWDGFETSSEGDQVMVIGATNLKSQLDTAALRRMPLQFKIDAPDRTSRIQILKLLLKNERVSPNLNFEKLADITNRFSGSDLTELCKKALSFPIKELIDRELQSKTSMTNIMPRELVYEDFVKAREFVNPSCVEENEQLDMSLLVD
nr:unnamed protein product [Naegleria fowleri]